MTPVWLQFAGWAAALEALGAAALPAAAWAFPSCEERAIGFSRIFGWLICAWLIWLLQHLAGAPFSPGVCWGVVCCAAAVMIWRFGPRAWLRLWGRIWREWAAAAAVFWGMFLLALAFRSMNPEIFWGEKPMDFTFLNYFIRQQSLPPEDPWAAGRGMGYYYFGYYLFAFLHQLSGADPRVGYNLAVASCGGFLAVAVFSAVRLWTGRAGLAAAFAFLAAGCGNFEWIRLAAAGRPLDYSFFWDTARLLSPPAFAEHPAWALIFGDLHPHLISQPFFAALVAAASVLFLRGGRAAPLPALVWGGLIAINGWDAITGGALAAAFGLFSAIGGDLGWRAALGRFAWLCAAAAMLFFPFLPVLWEAGRFAGTAAWSAAAEFNSPGAILRHFGVWLAPAAVGAGLTLRRHWGEIPRRGWAAAGVCGAAPIAAAAAHPAGSPWGVAILSAALAACGAAAASARGAPRAVRAGGTCLFAAGMIVCGAEIGVAVDRMNTVFKLYNGVWLLLSLSAAAFWGEILPPRGSPLGACRRAAAGSCAAGFLLAAAGSGINFWIVSKFPIAAGPRPTLDGAAYLAAYNPDEAELVAWINSHVKGTPALLEAFGPPYGPYARISMHTGLPAVLGWHTHVRQRGASSAEIKERALAIALAYRRCRRSDFEKLRDRYGVRYIVWGELERLRSGRDAPPADAGLTEVFSRPAVRLYALSGDAKQSRCQ